MWQDITEPDADGWRKVKCDACGVVAVSPLDHARIVHQCPHGPGTELKKLFAELGIAPTASCTCNALANEMNMLGPDGVARERARLLVALEVAYDHATLATKAKALGAALWNGLPLTLDGLLSLAVERSRLAPPPPSGQ